MYLKQSKRNGRIYLSIAQSYRKDGKVKTKTIKSLGYADEYEDVFEDPISHFRQEVRRLNQQEDSRSTLTVSILKNEQISATPESIIDFGSAATLAYLDAFKFPEFFSFMDLDSIFSPATIRHAFELLVSARMMHVAPIVQTWNSRLAFLRNCNFTMSETYHILDLLSSQSEAVINHLNKTYENLRRELDKSSTIVVLSDQIIHLARALDGASFKFIKDPEKKDSLNRLRFCTVVDRQGIPFDYFFVPADASVNYLISVIDSIKYDNDATKITCIAGEMKQSPQLMKELENRGYLFILPYPQRYWNQDTRNWIFDAKDYTVHPTRSYAFKSRRTSLGEITSVRQVAITTKSSQIASHNNAIHCLVSNNDTLKPTSLFNYYREIWRIREPFQIIEADFIQVPYPITTPNQIKAHFVICYAAFFLLRVMREDLDWEYNAAQVAESLRQLNGVYLVEDYFLFSFRNEISDRLEAHLGLPFSHRVLSKHEIKHSILEATAKASLPPNRSNKTT